MYFRKNLSTGLFGGEGFILQKFTGTGMLFLEIDGEVLEYDLQPGEKLVIDQGHVNFNRTRKSMDTNQYQYLD